MALERVPQKYWKKSHGCYYVKLPAVEGRREDRRLDPDPDKADLILCDIIAKWKETGDIPPRERTFAELLILFLDHVEASRAKKTYKTYRYILKKFNQFIPANLKVVELKPHHVTRWLDKFFPANGKNSCTDNTRRDAIGAVKRVLNWGVDEGYIDHNPLARLKKPPMTPRDTYLTPAQWQQVLSLIPDEAFRDFILVLLHTGCRPQEARMIEARYISFPDKLVRLPKEISKGKRRERRIRLDDVALAILQKYASRYPTGPVLRNVDGNPWKATAITSRFNRLRPKLPFNAHAYLARHSFATTGLTSGVSTAAMAELLGHVDKTMILKTYGHVDQCEDHLQESLKQATKRLPFVVILPESAPTTPTVNR